MDINLLRDIAGSIAGEKAKGIVEILFGKKNVNEFLIARKMGLTINQTRNLLYKLGDEGIVSFVRKKDKKKGGWYTYFWTLNLDKSLIKFKDVLIKNIGHLKEQAHHKKTEKFYYCTNCNQEFTEGQALLQEYTCPECGEILQIKENSKEIIIIEKEILKIEVMLKEIENELRIIKDKDDRARVRRFREEEKTKIKERMLKKKIRAREHKKMMNVSRKLKRNGKKAKESAKKRRKVHKSWWNKVK